jgi:hypothetical protein
MNNNYYKFLNNLLVIILCIIIITIIKDNYFLEVNICDSGSITDNYNNVNDNNNNMYVDLTKLNLTDRIRRRISWYISAMNNGGFNSYNEFKNTWNPKTKIWNEIKLAIKEDIKKSRLEALKTTKQSEVNANRLMSDIRNTQIAAYNNRMKRYVECLNKK